jgi:hypothetical protein
VALAHGEKVGSFFGGWGARVWSLYNARANRRPKFGALDTAIARGRQMFLCARDFGASAGGAQEGFRTVYGR